MRPPYLLAFFCSLITLSFEILLIRIFSVRLSYHYASLIISLSMAGLVIGGVIVFFQHATSRPPGFSSHQRLQRFAAALAVSCPAVFMLLSLIPLDHVRMLWENVQVVYLVVFIFLCTIPFFLYGVFISSALSAWRDTANRVYATDLVGGATGILLVVMLMDALKMEYILVIVTAVTGWIILSALRKTPSKIVMTAILFGLCLCIVLDASSLKMSPYKGLSQALKDDGAKHVATIYSSHSRLDLFENPQMKFAPGLSLTFTEPVPKGLGMALDGEIAGVVMERKEQAIYKFLSYIPSALPYLIHTPDNVVIIGARNSIDLLLPKYYGVVRASIAEHDASVVKVFSCRHGSIIHPFPVFYGSGRTLLKKLDNNLGLIFLSKTGFFPSGSFGLQEDYDLTVEAIGTYMQRLNNNGILFIQMFLVPPPRSEVRLAKNIQTALEKIGIHELANHLLIYRSWDTINFLIKKDGLSETEFRNVRQFLANRQFDVLYPDIAEQEQFIAGLDYKHLFYRILTDRASSEFSSSYAFEIRETTDDRPFFHYFLKTSKLIDIYKLSGRKWAYFLHEGMSLPFILVCTILFTICIFVIVLILTKKKLKFSLKSQKSPSLSCSLIYFALIGFAFMFIEVFFIHRLILPFGSPVKAFSVTLVTILVSAGMGSIGTGWFTGKKTMVTISLAPLLIIANYFFFDLADESVLSAIFIIPIGIVLGFFFPVGLRFLVTNKTGQVPLAYTANGAASIIAPSLVSLVAVSYGCKVLLLLAAFLYILAIAIILPVIFRVLTASKYS